MVQTLTQEHIDNHMKDPTGCPLCKSISIEGGPVHVIGSSCHQSLLCHSCLFRWREVYKLVTVEEV